MAIATGRLFRLWAYRVSHARLLLRSPRSAAEPKNVDLELAGVRYVQLPALADLELVDTSAEDHHRAEQVLGAAVPREQVYAFAARGRRYLVVAGALGVVETEFGPTESNLDRA